MEDTDATLWVGPDGGPGPGVAAADTRRTVWSLEELRQALASAVPHARRTLDGPGAGLAVALATAQGNALSATDVAQLQGWADAVEEARQGRVRAGALAGVAAKQGGQTRVRLAAVAQALGAYEGLLHRRGLADGAGSWDDARAALADGAGWPRPLERFARVVVRLEPPLAPVVLEALVALARLAERTGRALRYQVPVTGEATLDAAVEPLFSTFESHPELSPLLLERDVPPTEAPLARAVEALGLPAAHPAPALVFSSAHADACAQVLAAEARRAVQAGAPPHRCAVLVPDVPAAEEVAAALEAAGLPLGVRPGRTLASTAAGRLGVLVARLQGEAFPAPDVGWLLGCGLLPGLRPQAPPAATALLERAGVRDEALGGAGGQGAYRVRLEALAQREARSPRSAQARQLLAAAEALFALVRALPAKATLAAHLLAWQRALETLGFWRAPALALLPEGPEATPACRVLAREVQAREAWRAVVRGARGALAALGSEGPQLLRSGFAAWLAEAAARHRLPKQRGRPGGVAVLLYEEAPGRAPFAWLGAPALAEGHFPRPLLRAGALTDEDRFVLNRALGRDAFPLRYGSADVRPLAALALDGWRLGVALSHAQRAALGFARDDGFRDVAAPASFLDAFARSAGVTRVDWADVAVPKLARAGSERELREAVALATGPDSTDGPARALGHLLEGEGWLARARALGGMEAERARAFEFPETESGPFSGAVGEGALQEALGRRYAYGREAPLSASTLGKFGRCAFQGFVHSALRLEQPEAPGEGLDARGQGSLWHAVLESLMPRLAQAGLLGRPFRDVPQALLEAALDDGARALQARFSPGHPRLFTLARERARWMVRRVLDAAHHGLPFEGLLPVEAETSFGRANAPPDWREVRLPAALPGERDVCLTGAVDRLDAGPAGVGVLDYKASRRRDAERELLRTDFQLPFYLQAVRARGERRPLRAGWLVLKSGEFQPFAPAAGQAVLLATDASTRAQAKAEGLPNLANATQALVQKSRQGDFGARPLDCGFCPFGPVCRIGSRRKEARW
jgi:ATP-dependent helicase/nuclease subunit B